MSAKFTLYDLASQEPRKCWSYNPWKTRLLLNYKALPYETEWVEYPEIKPKFEGLIPPNKEGAAYTIPTVKFPDGSYLQDSRQIANRIEKEHPSPELHLNSDMLTKLEEILPKITGAVRPDFVPKMPTRILNEASHEYWHRTRSQALGGKPLDQVERESGGPPAWKNAAPHIQEVSKLLRVHDNGPFFEGNQVTYVDLVWAGWLRFMQRIGDDMLDNVYQASGDADAHKTLLKACGPWLARDDH